MRLSALKTLISKTTQYLKIQIGKA